MSCYAVGTVRSITLHVGSSVGVIKSKIEMAQHFGDRMNDFYIIHAAATRPTRQTRRLCPVECTLLDDNQQEQW